MLTGLFALLLGIVTSYAGYTYVALARRMRFFRSVPGTIIARAVVVVPSGNTRTGVYGQGGGYMPSVRYRYAVDGTELEGDKITFAYAGYKHAIAERKLAEIPDAVAVWYNPQKPTEAYLERHTPALGALVVVFGVMVALGGVIEIVASR